MMKIHWGTGIVISFVLFIAFIGFMVVKIFKSPELQHELVTTNYYQKEQTLNQLIEGKKNAQFWSKGLVHCTNENYVFLSPLPAGKHMEVIGYCPSNAAKDFTETLMVSSSYPFEIKLPRSRFGHQKWELQLRWQHNDSTFVVDYLLSF